MIICSKCGTELIDNVKFCTNCGNKIIAATAEPIKTFASQPVNPVPTETVQIEPNSQVSRKSRLAALLLGIFLGGIGIHNFYLGKIGKGIAQAIMYVLGFVLYFYSMLNFVISAGLDTSDLSMTFPLLIFVGCLLLIAVGIWSLVEWIIIACGKATDKNGLPVTNW